MTTTVTAAPPAPTAPAVATLTCDGTSIHVVTAAGTSPDPVGQPGSLDAWPGVRVGTFSDCYRPGETVAFYGPFATQDEAFASRRVAGDGSGTIVTLDPYTADLYGSGLCALNRSVGTPPKLSDDPSIGLTNSPWVFELVDYLHHGGYLGADELGGTRMTPAVVDAVSDFQFTVNLEADGIIGSDTWYQLLYFACHGGPDIPPPADRTARPQAAEPETPAQDPGPNVSSNTRGYSCTADGVCQWPDGSPVAGADRCGTLCGEEPTSGEVQFKFACEEGLIPAEQCTDVFGG